MDILDLVLFWWKQFLIKACKIWYEYYLVFLKTLLHFIFGICVSVGGFNTCLHSILCICAWTQTNKMPVCNAGVEILIFVRLFEITAKTEYFVHVNTQLLDDCKKSLTSLFWPILRSWTPTSITYHSYSWLCKHNLSINNLTLKLNWKQSKITQVKLV